MEFPLLSRSRLLERLIREFYENAKGEEEKICVLQLHNLPGGTKSFLLITKFYYCVKVELSAGNVVSLRCASEYLQMTEDYGEVNLIAETESFLNDIFESWVDTVKALETCEDALPLAKELHIISRCVDSLATKACADPNLCSSSVSGCNGSQSPVDTALWNRIRSTSREASMTEDWWHKNAALLQLSFFKRFIESVGSKGMAPERIAGQ